MEVAKVDLFYLNDYSLVMMIIGKSTKRFTMEEISQKHATRDGK